MKNVKLTLNSTPVGNVILFIGGRVEWEGGPVDWRAWETWMGDIGYRGRGCVIKVDRGMLRELKV